MAAGPDRSQKTEQPSPKRKREARERGQVAKSADIATWVGLLVASVLVQETCERGATAFSSVSSSMARVIASPDEREAMSFFGDAIWQGVLVALPLMLGLALAVIVSNLAQVGLKPSMKRLKPDFKRLNVMKGLKKLFAVSAWWELAKSVAKVALLVVVAWPVLHGMVGSLTTGSGALDDIVAVVAHSCLVVVRNVAIAGLVIAAADYIVQRRRLQRDIMMTRQEVREEMRQQEGDPHMRGAIRSRQMSVSRNRMIRMVADADVVLVNPTHYAVALRYDAARPAPEVLAKGTGAVARRIRAEAEANGVPIVREPALARAIHRVCPVGGFVPVDLYEAVAHVLAFVFGLKASGRAAGGLAGAVEHTLPTGWWANDGLSTAAGVVR